MFYLRAVCQRVRPVIWGWWKSIQKKMADIFQHCTLCIKTWDKNKYVASFWNLYRKSHSIGKALFFFELIRYMYELLFETFTIFAHSANDETVIHCSVDYIIYFLVNMCLEIYCTPRGVGEFFTPFGTPSFFSKNNPKSKNCLT